MTINNFSSALTSVFFFVILSFNNYVYLLIVYIIINIIIRKVLEQSVNS